MDSRFGAIVLCGGASSRMGREKASLPWGPRSTLLQQVLDVLQSVCASDRIVVVAGDRQVVPALPKGLKFVRESHAGAGPLVALVEGLARLPEGIDRAFACGCDTPFLQAAFVERLAEYVAPAVDAVVPTDGARLYPLAAIYAKSSSAVLRTAVHAGERALHRALRGGGLTVREVDVDELRIADRQLDSLVNCNTPEEYQRALARAGLAT